MKKQPKEEKVKWWRQLGVIAEGSMQIIGFFVLVSFGCFFGYDFFVSTVQSYFEKYEKSPGELVDLAIKENPNYITISPRRDLVEMGIIHAPMPVYTAAPAIAVHIGQKWCIWSLGRDATNDMGGTSQAEYGMEATIYGNWLGYQYSYHSFTECIKGPVR